MVEWVENCEICNTGLCSRMDQLIAEGKSEREAARVMEEEARAKAKQQGLDDLISANAIRKRYQWHTGRVSPTKEKKSRCIRCGNEFPVLNMHHYQGFSYCDVCLKARKETDKEQKEKEAAEEKIPWCPNCRHHRVYKTKEGNWSEFCRTCQKKVNKLKEDIEKEKDLDAIPVDPEAQKAWNGIPDLISQLTSSIKDARVQKIEPDLYESIRTQAYELESHLSFKLQKLGEYFITVSA